MTEQLSKAKQKALTKAIRKGMHQAAAQGIHVGRPKGSSKTAETLVTDYPLVVEALNSNLSLR